MLGKGDWLRPLQVRVAGHDGLLVLLCLLAKDRFQLQKVFHHAGNFLAEVQPEIQRDLIVPASGRVQALSGISDALGLLLIMLFSLKLGWLPSGGYENGMLSLILPAFTIGAGLAAFMTRSTRSSMLDVIRQDYLRMARAKGVSERKVIRKHALRNALIPIITVFGVQFSNVLGGSVLAETVFAWPGVGRLVVDAIDQRDIPMVTGALVMTTMIVSIVNLLIDIVYAFVDPRIKSQYTK